MKTTKNYREIFDDQTASEANALDLLLQYLQKVKPDIFNCFCGTNHSYFLRDRRTTFQCTKCKKEFAPLTHTVFAKSKIPFHYIIKLTRDLLANKESLSRTTVENLYCLSDKTASRILKCIRKALGNFCANGRAKEKLSGKIQIDATPIKGLFVVGGLQRNMEDSIKAPFRLSLKDNESPQIIRQFIQQFVEPGSYISVDEKNRCLQSDLSSSYRIHVVPAKDSLEFQTGCSNNDIEGRWNGLKIMTKGLQNTEVEEHLKHLLFEFEFRQNYVCETFINDIEMMLKLIVI